MPHEVRRWQGPGGGARGARRVPTTEAPSSPASEEEARGGRPGSVTDIAQQGQFVRHTGEHVDEICPHVPILDVPVPQMGDQVVEVLRKFDVPSVKQVIAVPISFDFVPQRSAVCRPQKAEQLVEVPTEPGYALAVIATKALGRRAAAALAEQIVHNPVPQGRRGGGWRSSRFSCKTEFNSSGRGANR